MLQIRRASAIRDNFEKKFPYFSIKLHIVTPHYTGLAERVLMRGHNIMFSVRNKKK